MGAAPQAPSPAPGPTEAVTYQIGVSHDGYSGDSTLAPPLTARWSRDLPGEISYPLIAAGKVFVINVDGLLRAFDANTGALAWSTQLSQYLFSSPPTAQGGVVYVGGSGGGGTL